MKKFFKYMAIAAVALVTTTAFTACDDDDDDNNGKQTTATIETWQWTASDTISPTLSAVFDYETTVTLPNGNTQTFQANFSESSGLSGILIAANISYPATITVTTVRKLAEGYTPTDDETVSGKEAFGLSISGLDSKNLVVKGGKTGASSNISNVRVKDISERYPNGMTVDTHSLTIIKNADGSYTLSE